MTEDERHPRSFEEAAREVAGAGVDPDRVRDWVETAGDSLRAQFEDAGGRDPRREPSTRSGGELFRDAEPHPLDAPTPERGLALAGRWTLEPGMTALSMLRRARTPRRPGARPRVAVTGLDRRERGRHGRGTPCVWPPARGGRGALRRG